MKLTVLRPRALPALGAFLAGTLGMGLATGTPTASAQSVEVQQASSQNWSGYVVRDSSGHNFSSVSGSWVQPALSASSTSRGQGYSAFWVGLGGAGNQSQSLEQVGTAAETAGGQASYYAWYELVPAAQVRLGLAIHPGDHMSGRVSVSGTSVSISISDQTTGQSVNKTLQMSNPDTSTAEWIAEAPAAVQGDGSMQILPLANFGKVTFTDSSATAGGHTGAIGDPAWTVQRVDLDNSGVATDVAYDPYGQAQQSSAGASTGGLSTDGSSFTVSYSPSGSSVGSGGGSGSGGYGGYGGGSGYSDGAGYPDSYGYPGADGYVYSYGYPGSDGYGYYGGYAYVQ